MVSKERWFNTAQNLQGLGLEISSKLSMKKSMNKSVYVYYERKNIYFRDWKGIWDFRLVQLGSVFGYIMFSKIGI